VHCFADARPRPQRGAIVEKDAHADNPADAITRVVKARI
jgi:hypothetical protein